MWLGGSVECDELAFLRDHKGEAEWDNAEDARSTQGAIQDELEVRSNQSERHVRRSAEGPQDVGGGTEHADNVCEKNKRQAEYEPR